MWMNKDYDELLTYSEWIDENGSEKLYEGTEMEEDEATQEAILDFFFYRKIVDNERFLRYFRRTLEQFEAQYYALVRVQTTQIDPLVTNYLERQIIRTGSRAESGRDTETETNNSNTRTTNSGTGNGSTITETEGTAQGKGTSTATTSEQGTASGSSTSDTKTKHGETPQSAVGSGGSMALDWTYLSSQDETATEQSNESQTSGSTSTIGNTTDNSSTTGRAETTTTDRSNSESATTGTGTMSRTGEASKSESTHADDRERLTGRNEAPQDLLGKARDYIENTNAFIWLAGKLDKCFLQVYDM